MPQFQILEENPSFGSQLAKQLGQGVGGGISSALEEFNKNKKSEQSAAGLSELLKQTGMNIDPVSLQNAIKGGISSQDILKMSTDLYKNREKQSDNLEE